MLKAEEEWKGTFTSVAKGHTYTAEEEIVEGFESMVTGHQTNGFTREPELRRDALFLGMKMQLIWVLKPQKKQLQKQVLM